MEETMQFGCAFGTKKTDEPGDPLDWRLLMAQAARQGFAGIELDSSILGTELYSNLDFFRTLFETYRLDPLCYVVQSGQAERTDTRPDPAIDPSVMIQHFHMARYLGFPSVRIQPGISHQEYCELVPYAERCGIWLGLEIYLDQKASTEQIQDCVDLIDQHGSKHAGFILNVQVPQKFREQSPELGANQGLSHELVRLVLPHTRIIRMESQDGEPDTMSQLSDTVRHLEILANCKYYGWVVCDANRLGLD